MLAESRDSVPGRRPQAAKHFAPHSGARRKRVRKATAFRGGSEQDRFPLFLFSGSKILKTSRWDVFNDINFYLLQTSHRDVCKALHIEMVSQGGAVLFAPPRKSCRFFSPPSPCAGVRRRMFRRLRAATRASAALDPRQLGSAGPA